MPGKVEIGESYHRPKVLVEKSGRNHDYRYLSESHRVTSLISQTRSSQGFAGRSAQTDAPARRLVDTI
jgi:hypothetical protein